MSLLEPDYRSVPGQNFAVIAIVGPDCPQKTDKMGIKISGCFATRDEAGNYAKKLQGDCNLFDLYVVDLYKWLLIPPPRDEIQDTHYSEEKLEEIMTKYRENQVLASKMFEERKRDMIAKPIQGSFIKPGDENSKYYSKPDEPPISHPADVLERLQKEKPDAPMEELVVEADTIVADEIRERQKQRLLSVATSSSSEEQPDETAQ
jgi:hypothetical protein